jgi:hypothetical protein
MLTWCTASCEKIEYPFKPVDFDSALFNASTLPFQSFCDSDTHSEITSSQDADQPLEAEPETDDIWQLADEYAEPNPTRCVSWDSFLDLRFKEPATAYITEAGPKVFDAALKLYVHASPSGDGIDNILREDIFYSVCASQGLCGCSILTKVY